MVAVRPSSRLVAAAIAGSLATLILTSWLRAPLVRASTPEEVTLAVGSAVHLATPQFITIGKRYAFTWPGGGPPQTFLVTAKRSDGWILVKFADEAIRPDLYVDSGFSKRWVHAALAISVQELSAP